MESPNLEFEYGDTDSLTAELSGTTDQLLNSQEPKIFARLNEKKEEKNQIQPVLTAAKAAPHLFLLHSGYSIQHGITTQHMFSSLHL